MWCKKQVIDPHAIGHNKVMIIDGESVIMGSFNFTKAAEESNAENLLVIRERKLAERYIKNWQEHERHSEVYAGRDRSKNFGYHLLVIGEIFF